MTEADHAEVVALLVEAYDTMEDLAPDIAEEPDDDLALWIERAGSLLRRLTGEAPYVLITEFNRKRIGR
jgi:hypothetical protein